MLSVIPMVAAWDYGGVLPHTQWYLATALVIAFLFGIPLWLRAPNVKSKIRSANTAPQQQPSLGIPLVVVAIVAIGTLQTISWPAAITRWTSPGTHSAYVDWIPESIEYERPGSSPLPARRSLLSRLDPMTATHPLMTGKSISETHPLSVTPWLTRRALFRPVVFGLLVMMGVVVFRNADRLKVFMALTGFFGALISFLGLADIMNMEHAEQWIDVASRNTASFASFVNRNNAGGYLNLMLASILGYFVWRQSATTEKARRQRGYRREYATAHYSRLEKIIRRGILVAEKSPIVLLSALVILGAIVSCGSRGTVLGTLAGLLAIALVRIGRKASPTKTIARIAIVILVLLVIGVVSMTDLAGTRLATLWQTDLAYEGRIPYWKDAAAAATHYLPMGSGLGTYRYAYLPYQKYSLSGWAINADGLPLEWLVEGGFWLLPLVITGLVMIVRMLAEIGKNSAHWPQGQAIVVTGLFMLCSQVVSQAFDFGILLPSNFMTFALLTGAIIATHTSLKQSLATNVQSKHPRINTTEPTALAAGPDQSPITLPLAGGSDAVAAGEGKHSQPVPGVEPAKNPSRHSSLASRILLFMFAAAVAIAMQDAKLDANADYQSRVVHQASVDELLSGLEGAQVAATQVPQSPTSLESDTSPQSIPAPLAPFRDVGLGVAWRNAKQLRSLRSEKLSGSPRPASGRGAGGEGLTRSGFRSAFDRVSSAARPPHPQPFSPTKPGEKGARVSVARDQAEAVQWITLRSSAPILNPFPPLRGRPVFKLREPKELQISPSLREGRRRGTRLRGGVNRNTLSATSVSPPRVSSLRLASRPSQREGEVKLDDLLRGEDSLRTMELLG